MHTHRLLGIAATLGIAILSSCGRSPLDLGSPADSAAASTGGPAGAGAAPATVVAAADGSGAAPETVAGVGGGAVEGAGGESTTGSGDAGGGSGETTGGGGSGPGDPIACFSCVNESCPELVDCIQNPTCGQGLFCAFTQCLGGGGLPDFGCVTDCFDGDIGAAFDAIGAVTCLFSSCGDVCGGLLPGFPGG